MTTAMTRLPEGFVELEPFVAKWDKPSTNERYAERLASRFDELEAFHAAVRARLDDIKALLDPLPFEAYTEMHRCLARLAWAWVIVAEAVEVFKQPRVPDSKMFWDMRVEPEL
jgi:hypothetical protein